MCLCFFSLQPPQDALFARPRLFRACVPPGMHRFRGNVWDYDGRPQVMRALGYPLKMNDRIPEITDARNIELGLGLQVIFFFSSDKLYNLIRISQLDDDGGNKKNLELQLCFLHPSKHKFEHPRFCYERLEYVGQKIQVTSNSLQLVSLVITYTNSQMGINSF